MLCILVCGTLAATTEYFIVDQQVSNLLVDANLLIMEMLVNLILMFGLIWASIYMIETAIGDHAEKKKKRTVPSLAMPAFRAAAIHKYTGDKKTTGRAMALKENDMRTTYQSAYIETPDVNMAWVAFRTRLEVTGQTGPETLYAKNRFVVDDERMLSPEEGRSGGDFDIENNLIEKDKDAAAYRVIDDNGNTVGWLFAGLVLT